jgi:L-ascorbate metabolism protein UlaG (beta-lactamase superfamily)
MSLAVTWWGHASATVESGATRVAVDPLLTDRLFHLVRYGVTPAPESTEADVVVVSHLHADHCHLPSLKRFAPDVPIVVPAGAEALLATLGRDRLVPVRPGDHVSLEGVEIDVLAASHDGRRAPWQRGEPPPALGFRVSSDAGDWWYPGDTELRDDMSAVPAVDLALVPIGGWGPTLGDGHMHPEDAAIAVERVDAEWTVPVHWGTFWPQGLRRLARDNHHRLFPTPGERFEAALDDSAVDAVLVAPGERVAR